MATPRAHKLKGGTDSKASDSTDEKGSTTPGPGVSHEDMQDVRKINLGAGAGDSRTYFPSNLVSTTKYDLCTLVPKNLFEQFKRVANFWFLTVSICQMLPLKLSPTNQFATLVPLCTVLFVTFCKDAWEDYGRHRDDRRVNNQRCSVLPTEVTCKESEALVDTKWKDVAVGMYVKLERDSPIPADMILLSCSNEDGVAYVDTAQLDGETSLKPKFVLEETMRVTTAKQLRALEGHVDTEPPNERVQSFSGTLFLRGVPRGVTIDAKNFLLRGSTLRNIAWVHGLVVFTGFDTKLMRNLKETPSKRSRVEVISNKLLGIVFSVMVGIAVVCTILRATLLREGSSFAKTLKGSWPETDSVQDNQYLAWITFMIGYNNLIPISLYVTTDLVRTFQGFLMERDRSMYHPPSESHCCVRNSGLNENLGQVEYVLTDKTGTLTENEMRFKACCIRGKVYGCWDETTNGPVDNAIAMPPSHVCQPLDPSLMASEPQEASRASSWDSISDHFPDLGDKTIDQFFMCLATCHTAMVENITNTRRGSQRRSEEETIVLSQAAREMGATPSQQSVSQEAMRVAFRSPSPDEEALVAAARDYGYYFRKKVGSRMTINVRGADQEYVSLLCNEFSSERKRMSVLVRRRDTTPQHNGSTNRRRARLDSYTGEIDCKPLAASSRGSTLYIKGADNVILERLTSHSLKNDPYNEATLEHLSRFSSTGLRTLICAKRELTAQETNRFVQKMQQAKGALMNRDHMMEVVADEMERHLELLGVTAIEDRIQQGVPETINMLIGAGVKVWMLTGDNMETAVNIAVSCHLIDHTMKKYKLDVPTDYDTVTPDYVEKMLSSYYERAKINLKSERQAGDFKYSIIIHGKVLYTIMKEEQVKLRQLFLTLACTSSSVIACRLAPAQKAALVRMVRNGVAGSPLTLAIGDGGNDVSMIQEAHVGVGLLGVEGRQAANAADYVIGQFRFLQPMLFVHGRWNLRRISLVIGFSFYKNFLLVLPMVLFAPLTGFSGTTLYDSWLLASYNVFFTHLPIMIVGIFDWDVTRGMALMVPRLYQLGIQGLYFNSRMLVGWILRGAWHSLVLFMVMLATFYEGSFATATAYGENNAPDFLVMGSWTYWGCVWVANIVLLLHTRAWMDWYVLTVVFSISCFTLFLQAYTLGLLGSRGNPSFVGVPYALFGSCQLWLGLFLAVGTCGICELAVCFARRVLTPDAADIVQEIWLGFFHSAEGTAAWDGATIEDTPEACLKSLPMAPPTLSMIKPERRVGWQPLRQAKLKKSMFRADKLTMVSPVPQAAAEDSVHMELSSTSFSYHTPLDHSIVFPPTRVDRFVQWLNETLHQILERQWCKMTVAELVVNLNYDRIEVSKHCKSSLRTEGAPKTEKEVKQDCLQGAAASPASHESVVTASSVFSERSGGTSNDVVKDLMYSIVTLRFSTASQETAFKKYLAAQAVKLFEKSLLVFYVVVMLYNLYRMVIEIAEGTINKSLGRALFVVLMLLSCGAGWKSMRTRFFKRHAETCITTCVMLCIAGKHMYDYLVNSSGMLTNSYMPVFIIAGAQIRFTHVAAVLLFHMVTLFTRYWVLPPVVVEGETMEPNAEYFVLMVGISVLSLFYSYQLEKLFRKDFFVLNSIEQSKHQTMEILRGMFPDEVIHHVVRKIRKEECDHRVNNIREDRGIVTIIFCDVMDFDNLVETLEPIELVQLLDTLWMMFDRIVERHDVIKIETVGKTYMAAGMAEDPTQATPEHNANNATACVLTAIGMLDQVSRRIVGLGKETKVSVRIGIHTGNVISGVVGSQKPQFALFGDTVNTASRMQSHGKTNCVHISNSTYEMIKDDPQFEWQGLRTYVKGKGEMDTYLLKRRIPVSPRFRDMERNMTMMGMRTQSNDSGYMEKQVSDGPPEAVASCTASESPRGSPMQSHALAVAEPSPIVPSVPEAAALALAEQQSEKTPPPQMPTVLIEPSTDTPLTCTPPATICTPPGTLTGDHDRTLFSCMGGVPMVSTHSDKFDPCSSVAVNAESGSFDPAQATSMSPSAGEELRPEELWYSVAQGGSEAGGIDVKRTIAVFAPTVLRASTSLTRRQPTAMLLGDMKLSAGCWFPRFFLNYLLWYHQRVRQAPIQAQWGSFIAYWVCYVLETIAVMWGPQGNSSPDRSLYLLCRLGYLGLAGGLGLVLYQAGFKRQTAGGKAYWLCFIPDMIASLVFFGFIISSISNSIYLADTTSSFTWHLWELLFFLMVIMYLCRLHIKGLVPVALCVVVAADILIVVAVHGDSDMLYDTVTTLLFITLSQLLATQGDPRRAHAHHKAICDEHAGVTQLLDSMLPREVMEDMKSGSLSLAYTYKEMTFLFADIVGFTNFCAEHTAEQAVNLVTRLFAAFDEQTVKLGIYKVCTIGDAYVVVNEPRQLIADSCTECSLVFTMAKWMLRTIVAVRKQVQHDALDMRIGLHYGHFVGGVIGTTRLRFDIWGEDVLIGNNVESHGKKGEICVSDRAKQILKRCSPSGALRFTFNQDMELKNGTKVATYLCSPEHADSFLDEEGGSVTEDPDPAPLSR